MKQLSNVLAVVSSVIVAALIVLNWSSLMISAPLNLVVARVEAPLGVVILGLAAVLVTLFLVAYLHNQVGTLLETRKLLKEVQRVQGLADKAEESRVENLHQLIATEFRLLNERLSSVAPAAEPDSAAPEGRLRSLAAIVTGRERSSA